jgi:hypothetical protein
MASASSAPPELMASAPDAPELMASAPDAPELMASESRNFLLRKQTRRISKLASELNEKNIFHKLPIDVKGIIDKKVIDKNTVVFCNRLSSIQPNIRMDPKVFLEQCSDFIKEVQVFIERMGSGDINPKKQYLFGDTCLEYVEKRCLFILDQMSNYRCNTLEQLDELKIQLDVLRNMIIYFLAENRNTANKEMLKEVLVHLDDSEFKKFLSSTQRLILICIKTLRSNTNPLVVKDFETRALTLLEECSDIFVSILTNERISVQLKKQTMDLFTYMMDEMFLIFRQAQQPEQAQQDQQAQQPEQAQQDQQAEQDQQAGVQHEMLHSTRQKYRELKNKYKTIADYLKEKYSPSSAQRRGGYSQIQSKNKSKRKNNKKNKNKKNKKKTLHLRIKK